jgi:hypothetical protein
MASSKIVLGADNLARILGPTRKDTGVALDNTNSGATSLARMFDERKETEICLATTRFRASENSGSSSFTIPNIYPQWLEAGDIITIVDDFDQRYERTVSLVTGGTDIDVPATNFDTVTITGVIETNTSAGTKVFLKRKAATAVYFPIRAPQRQWEDGDAYELRANDLSAQTGTIAAYFAATDSSQDGAIAIDQAEYAVMELAAPTVLADVGSRIRAQIGGDIAMSEFPSGGAGTPPDPVAWVGDGGFSGTIPDTQLGLKVGDMIRVEIHFNGGAGLQLIDAVLAPVVES